MAIITQDYGNITMNKPYNFSKNDALPYNVDYPFTITNGCVTIYNDSYNALTYYAYVQDGVITEVKTNSSYITSSYVNGQLTLKFVGPTYAAIYHLYVFADEDTVLPS